MINQQNMENFFSNETELYSELLSSMEQLLLHQKEQIQQQEEQMQYFNKITSSANRENVDKFLAFVIHNATEELQKDGVLQDRINNLQKDTISLLGQKVQIMQQNKTFFSNQKIQSLLGEAEKLYSLRRNKD